MPTQRDTINPQEIKQSYDKLLDGYWQYLASVLVINQPTQVS